MFRKFSTITFLKRNITKCRSANYVMEELNKKSLITVVGEEASGYLQGLITNDINHLSNNCSSLYAMFLNSKGRVLYDSIIYRIDPKTYVVECDSTLAESLMKHLKIYRLRRKIDVFLSDFNVHVLFNKQYHDELIKNEGKLMKMEQSFELDVPLCSSNSLKLFKDPRVSQLGYRILSKEGIDLNSELSKLINMHIDNKSELSYKKYRYSLGVGEGIVDHPYGECFPLESNGDYLHGISFHKGCYIGQELTARTYHTGVTRKRLMPLYFFENLNETPPQDLVSEGNRKIGKLRDVEGNVGLGLMRLESIETNMVIGGVRAVVGKPFWWAIEAPKEKMGLKK